MLRPVQWGRRGARRQIRLGNAVVLGLAAFAVLLGDAGAATAAEGPGRLAYTAGLSPAATVWTAEANGSARRKLGLGTHPVVSPSGALVAAGALSPQGMPLAQVILYSTAGSEAVPVSLTGEGVAPLAFSPDSKYLAVEFTRGIGGGGLAVLDVETHSLTYVTNKPVAGRASTPRGPTNWSSAPTRVFPPARPPISTPGLRAPPAPRA